MAHRIVWCSTATVDAKGRRARASSSPIWDWDGTRLTGWVATSPTPTWRAHLAASPHVSCNCWAPSQDTCSRTAAQVRDAFSLDGARITVLSDPTGTRPSSCLSDPPLAVHTYESGSAQDLACLAILDAVCGL